MTFSLPPLPFSKNALAPHMSERTLEFHYEKHHQGYVTKLNTVLTAEDQSYSSLEHVIAATRGDSNQALLFNNAAQVWNHTFFWQSLNPGGGGEPADGPLRTALVKTFGSVEAFKEAFKALAMAQFGSGWTWLVLNAKGDLELRKTPNADLPDLKKEKPLVTCDVWEHAYYLDYQNQRPTYLEVFLDHLIHWDFMEEQLKAA